MHAALCPLVFALVAACTSSRPSPAPVVRNSPAPAPACTDECLPSVTLVDVVGKVHAPESLSGKIVIVNFWASWAKPSLTEMPVLARIHEKYGARDVVIFGVPVLSVDNETLSQVVTEHPMPYPVIEPTKEVMAAFDSPRDIPTTFIYDRRGKRVASKVGPFTEPEMTALIEKLLADRP
jgi:thiol-disulfide isomerase/thioredoxin